jgi:hypothetical protein
MLTAIMLSVIMLTVIILIVIECHHAECHYPECHYDGCLGAHKNDKHKELMSIEGEGRRERGARLKDSPIFLQRGALGG